MHNFRVWAPTPNRVRLQLRDQILDMEGPDKRGYWHLRAEAACGDDYAFLVDDDPTPYPDPRSLSQPKGVHGLSRLYDQKAFQWHDGNWRGSPKTSAVFYEIHVGTFSEEGTFDGAIQHLDHLVDLGITHIELMPVAEFAGNRGWGYDGVALFAVFEPYGGPDALKRFIDACHQKCLCVVLDVVYNHFGPVGNYTSKFGPYLTDKYHTPWGAAVNFNEGGSDEVRRFFCDNALMWLRDYHCDGLRLDAVHEFIDRSAVHFLEQLSAEVEQLSAMLGRDVMLIAESDLNDPRIVRPREAHGYGIDTQWSDDFHHALFTVLYDKEQGRAYYDDFGKLEHLEKALRRAFVFEGMYSKFRGRSHGRPVDNLSAHHFVHFTQNHDQVGNRAFGERLEQLVGLEASKVAVGILLMSPYLPLLFMGEEFAASTPFLYFADHEDEDMRKLVSEGRKREFSEFGYTDGAEIPNPEDDATLQSSKLKWSEVHEGKHAEMLQWTRDLIHLRRGTMSLNDGDMGHIDARADDAAQTLVITRDEVRTLVNFSSHPVQLPLLEGETLRLASQKGISIDGQSATLPPMSLAVLMRSRDFIQ